MIRRSILLLTSIVVCGFAAGAQPTLNRGDLLVVRDRSYEDGHPYPTSSIEVYGRDGIFEGTLVIAENKLFGDLFYRDGIIYVASTFPPAIERFDSRGNALSPFTTDVLMPGLLSPGPAGGVLVMDGGLQLRQLNADGSLIRVLGPPTFPYPAGGVDLGADGCTVFYASFSRIARWNACLNSPPEFVTPSQGTGSFSALRVLPDGTFLVHVGGGLGTAHERHGHGRSDI